MTIAICATAALVLSFAVAVYINSLVLLPGFAQRGLWLRYALALVVMVAVLDLGVVLLIQFIYDKLWGADPLRYGFWFNMAMDGAGIVLHLAGAMALMWAAKCVRRSAPVKTTVL